LASSDGQVITLEGQIEDIDIVSESGIETIQCKYHEDKSYSISKVAEPILDMFCHFSKSKQIGKRIKYILYAYFFVNVEFIAQSDFDDYIKKTTNQDIIVKYFHQIFEIGDLTILALANKAKKTKADKAQIIDYFVTKQTERKYLISLDDFFECFEYRKADKHEALKSRIIKYFEGVIDTTTAFGLYYPNAFYKVAMMSSLSDASKRTITKAKLLTWLSEQKILLANKWVFEKADRKKVLKGQKSYLSQIFAGNTEIRAFVFSNSFLKNNEGILVSFFIEYVKKYFSKKKLQKQPIFILESDISILQEITMGLHSYQIKVNHGYILNSFIEDCFANDTDCPLIFR